MKIKTTFLLFILPFFTFAQGPWEFNTAGNTEGWSATQGSAGASGILTATGTFIRYTTITGTSSAARNPTFTNAIANMDGNAFNSIQIRVKNGSRATYLRVLADGTSYYSIITESDNDYKTYTIVLNRTGPPIVSIAFEFRLYDASAGGANYVPQTTVPTSVGTNIDIDYIRPVNVVTPTRNVFNFNTASDVEGFTTLTRATAIQATDGPNGTLKMTATAANTLDSKVALNAGTFTVDGTTNKYAHITLKNTSNNTLFQLNGKVAGVATAFNPIQTYTISDTEYKTYDFDLSTWDSGSQFPELNFGVKTNWVATETYAIGSIVISGNTYCKNITGANSVLPALPHTDTTNWVIVNASGTIADASPATNGAILGGALNINPLTNSVYIDSIVFNNILSAADFGNVNNTISLYPNPANDVLNISSSNSITKIEVYDIQGRNVATNNNSSNVNVVSLGKGVYIIKVAQENGSVITKQFIKE